VTNRSAVVTRRRGRDRCTGLVEVEQLAVQAAMLVQVAAGDLDPPGVLDAARLHRVEPGGGDEPFDGRSAPIVVGRVEQHPRRGLRFASLPSDGAPRLPNAFT